MSRTTHHPSILNVVRQLLNVRSQRRETTTLMIRDDHVRRRTDFAVISVARGIGISERVLARSVGTAVARRGGVEESAGELVLGDGGAEDERCGEDRAVVGVVECGRDWRGCFLLECISNGRESRHLQLLPSGVSSVKLMKSGNEKVSCITCTPLWVDET